MQLSKLSKGLLIAIPALVLTACGSTSEDQNSSAASSTNGVAQTAQSDDAVTNNNVQVATAERELTPEEAQQQKFDTLRQESQTVYFDYDKSKVDAKYLELLQAHADFLVKNPSQSVKVEGHCDERGTPEYNIALGERRAKAVSQYLQSLGVTAGQITTVSYGEEKPIDLSRTNAGFAKNRRVELVY